MNVPIWLEQRDGRYVATSVVDPQVRVEAETREAALVEIRRYILEGTGIRELVFVAVPDQPADDIFGSMAGDTNLEEICAEAYRLRDQQFREEFPDEGV